VSESRADSAVEDDAGNVWIDIDGSDLWVVRHSDGAVVAPLGAIESLGGRDGSRADRFEYRGLTAGATSDRTIALRSQHKVLVIDDAAELVAGLVAVPPSGACQPPTVDAVDAPTFDVRRFRTQGTEFATAAAPDIVVTEAGNTTTIERAASSLTIEDADLAPYSEVRGVGDGRVSWTTEAGDLVVVGADDTVTTIGHVPGEYFSDAVITGERAAVLICPSPECETSALGVVDLASAANGQPVSADPAFPTDRYPAYFDSARDRVLMERYGERPAWISIIDGSLDPLGLADLEVSSVDAAGNVYLIGERGLVRVSGDDGTTEIVIPAPIEDPPSTLTQLDRELGGLDLFVEDVVADSDSTLFVSASDGVVLRISSDGGDVSYVAGGGPYTEGANVSLTGGIELDLTADRLVIRTWNTIASMQREDL
jgi:hypothetical protein